MKSIFKHITALLTMFIFATFFVLSCRADEALSNASQSNEDESLLSFLTKNSTAAAIILGIAVVIIILLVFFSVSILTLKKKNRELFLATNAKSMFLSNMSHEIRTPMNAIIGMVKLAEEEKTDNPALDNYLRQIDFSSKYLLGIINDILDMSRIERNKLELNRTWVTPQELLTPCIEMISSLFSNKGIRFNLINVEFIDDVEIFVDPLRIKQIFMNLLNNAYKFTEPGGLVTLEYKNVSTNSQFHTDKFIIRDTGCGMSKEFLKKIFEPFEQERSNNSSALKGTGLGLAIVKSIIDTMGGQISVESEPGIGSEFTFILPVRFRPAENKSSIAADSPSLELLRGKRILLAEDNKINMNVAKCILEKAGMVVSTAENGQIAWELYEKSGSFYYDVMLLDIIMPLMNGTDVAKKVRLSGYEDSKTIPIIAMTANAFDEDVKISLSSGMNDHLTKPVEPAKIYQAIAKALDNK